jgi:DNA-binding CsgD family transcriptional regulator
VQLVTDLARERAHEKIAWLACQPHDLVSFWRESTVILRTSISYYRTPCWYTLDPASLLITSHFDGGHLPEFPAEWLVDEYYADDVNQLVDVARSTRGISTLHESTNGEPSRSPRWQRNIELGGDQELIVRLRSRSGEVWGALGLYREVGQALFDESDKQFLLTLAPHLAEGARRALLVGEAVSRVLSRTGTWVVLHGATLVSGGSRRVAVIVEPAHPARIYPLLMSAYGLTERERDVTRLILQGRSTSQIAEQLVVSEHTIQQHLKSIFDKTDVRSRRDLVAKVFFCHYEPRFRDNERRTIENRPVRGGPKTS